MMRTKFALILSCHLVAHKVHAITYQRLFEINEDMVHILLISNISIFHVCMVWIEKSVTRVTDRHHEACRVMPSSDPE